MYHGLTICSFLYFLSIEYRYESCFSDCVYYSKNLSDYSLSFSLDRMFMKKLILLPALVLSLFLVSMPDPCIASEAFPVYPCLEPNVRFWIDVYTKYPTTKGIIHDSDDLSVIYDVIELWNPDKIGAGRINKKRINIAEAKYQRILRELSQGPPKDTEEERVADLFGAGAGRATFRTAAHNIRCQIGQSDRFEDGLVHSGAYIEEMKGVFRSYGLPEDLAYLPHVESSFNLKAHSKVGAAGIWQFTRTTGKRFLTVGHSVDERCDPILSTEAAAQLLKENFEKLKNWPMAITAYNHGMKGVRRAKRSKGGYEDVFTDYSSRRFRFASRNFYSEFLAARQVAKNYEQYFGAIELDKPLETRDILLEGHASIADLSSHFNVNVETIQTLNPALRRPVFKYQKYVPKGYTLRLPAGAAEDPELLSPQSLQDVYKPHQEPSRYYHVQRGDTLSEIAKALGLKVNDLIAANNLDSRGTIYVNQKLRLPLPCPDPTEEAKVKVTSLQAGETDQGRRQELCPTLRTLAAMAAVSGSINLHPRPGRREF
jgi:peptidoglycan lytic transglycosylase D